MERLEILEALVDKWSKAINLVSPSTLSDIWTRHIADSLQLNNLLPEHMTHCVDFGSGAGFPALVLAACRTSSKFTLIESDQRKCVFLKTAAREMGLSVAILSQRIETASPLNADVVTARALASLSTLLDLSSRHCQARSRCFFLKGRKAEQEIEDARKTWCFDPILHQSETSGEGRIIEIGEFHRVQ